MTATVLVAMAVMTAAVLVAMSAVTRAAIIQLILIVVFHVQIFCQKA